MDNAVPVIISSQGALLLSRSSASSKIRRASSSNRSYSATLSIRAYQPRHAKAGAEAESGLGVGAQATGMLVSLIGAIISIRAGLL